jgi:hypothetical protein
MPLPRDFCHKFKSDKNGKSSAFGIYRFYKGHILSGIVWLLTGGLFTIGWLVDWIWVLLGKKLFWPK